MSYFDRLLSSKMKENNEMVEKGADTLSQLLKIPLVKDKPVGSIRKHIRISSDTILIRYDDKHFIGMYSNDGWLSVMNMESLNIVSTSDMNAIKKFIIKGK